MNTNVIKTEFDVMALGFDTETLDARAIVMSTILRELKIEYRKYYTRKSNKSCKRLRKPDIIWDDMNIVFVAMCPEYYTDYVKYLYSERMSAVVLLRKMASD